jgi:hypothetical protein
MGVIAHGLGTMTDVSSTACSSFSLIHLSALKARIQDPPRVDLSACSSSHATFPLSVYERSWTESRPRRLRVNRASARCSLGWRSSSPPTTSSRDPAFQSKIDHTSSSCFLQLCPFFQTTAVRRTHRTAPCKQPSSTSPHPFAPIPAVFGHPTSLVRPPACTPFAAVASTHRTRPVHTPSHAISRSLTSQPIHAHHILPPAHLCLPPSCPSYARHRPLPIADRPPHSCPFHTTHPACTRIFASRPVPRYRMRPRPAVHTIAHRDHARRLRHTDGARA